jgi:hypothetical protein
VDEASYHVTGTFKFGDGTSLPVDGSAYACPRG